MEEQYFEVIKSEDGVSNTILVYNAIGGYYYDEEAGYWKQFSDRAFAQTLDQVSENHDVINIRLNSPGGSIYHGNAIINAIKRCTAEVHIYNDGLVASMAFPIFLSVPKAQRHASANSIFMMHAGSDFAWGNCKDLKEATAKLAVFDNSLIKGVAADSEMTEEEVRAQFFDYTDHWMNADELLELGLIDKVDDYATAKVVTIDSGKEQHETAQSHLVAQHAAYNKQEMRARLAAVSISKQQENNSTKMTKEELLQAVAEGKISPEDLQAAQESLKTPEQKMADAVTAAVTAAVKPLNEKIAGLEAKLGETPGAGNTQVPHTPTPPAEPDALAKANKEMVDNYTPGVQFSSES